MAKEKNLKKAMEDAKSWLELLPTKTNLTADEYEFSIAQVGIRLWVQTLILGLRRKEYDTNTAIAEELTERGEHCTGSTVGRWLAGDVTPQPARFKILEELHDEKIKAGKAAWRGQ